MQMKKYLILLVLAVVCCSTVQAQRYYIPRYKKQKEAREYEHFRSERKFTVTLGASFDMNLGVQNYINLENDDAAVTYDQKPKLPAATTTLGVGYRVSNNFVAGIEVGYSFSNGNHIIPAYGAFKWYYGKEKHPHRVRWFNYLNLGPQFNTSGKYHTIGALAAAGGGIRLLMAGSLRMDLYAGYRMSLNRPKVNASGTYDVPASAVTYHQYMHGIQVGLNIMMF